MKILVTGGAGFIGSAFVRSMLAKTEVEIVTLDKLTYASNLQSLQAVWQLSGHTFVQGDIGDAECVGRVLKTHQPHAVINLAAHSHVDRSIDHPFDFLNTNLIGTGVLLEESRQYTNSRFCPDPAGFRLLHVSTDEVFGDIEDGEPAVDENGIYRPNSPYAASKAGSDHLVRAWGETYGLPVMICHATNNYGPFQHPEKLIPHVILCALQNQPIPVYGDGSQRREWLYVEDHVAALWSILQQGQPGSTYNVGPGVALTNLEVVKRICMALAERTASPGNYTELIRFVSDRPAHDRRYALDSQKIRAELNWRPLMNFEAGLQQTVDWYLKNRDWWRSIMSTDYSLQRQGVLAHGS